MCGRYPLRKIDQVRGLFDALALPDFETFREHGPRYNIRPGTLIPVIRNNAAGRPTISLVKWGFVPFYEKSPVPRFQPINARTDKLTTSGMYRQAFARRRCLIPADGFYEPSGSEKPKRGEPARPQNFFHFIDDRLFAFAGIWDRWTNPEIGRTEDTVALITTEPTALTASVDHDRSPVILDTEHHRSWLDREVPGADMLGLLTPYPSDEMETWPVSQRVNMKGIDDPMCIAPTL